MADELPPVEVVGTWSPYQPSSWGAVPWGGGGAFAPILGAGPPPPAAPAPVSPIETPDQVDQAFAPPVPTVLPEVVITAPRTVTPPPVSAPSRWAVPALRTVARLVPWVFGLLVPLRTGEPDDFRNQPIAPRPPRKPPSVPVQFDPIMPPNWEDISREPFFEYTDLPGQRPFLPYEPGRIRRPDRIGDRPDLRPVFTPGDLPTPGELLPFPEPFRTPVPGPRRTPAPDLVPRPTINPRADPWGLPFAQPRAEPGPTRGPDQAPAPRDQPLPLMPGTPRIGDFPFFAAPPPKLQPPPRDQPGDGLAPTLKPDLFEFPFDLPLPQLADPCAAAKQKDKKPPRPPRNECWSGTYRQLSKGIIYRRRRRVPCQPTKGN